MHLTTRFRLRECIRTVRAEIEPNITTAETQRDKLQKSARRGSWKTNRNNGSHESSNKTKQIVFKFIKEQRTKLFIHRKCQPFDSTQLITCKPSTATYLTNCLPAKNKLILYDLVLSFRKQNVQIKCRAMPAYDRSHQSVKFDELQTLKSSNAFTTGSRASSILENNGHVSQWPQGSKQWPNDRSNDIEAWRRWPKLE